MTEKTLTEEQLASCAARMGVTVPALKAVLDVEAPRGGFLENGEVAILFEPHKFSEYTRGRFDKSHPDLSYPVWGTRPYGAYNQQHAKLQRAVALDRDAALKATSWGKPQILGANWAEAGAASLQDFINRMHTDEAAQVELMVGFIKSNPKRAAALKALNWAEFARLYNGPRFRANAYDTKLASAYRRFS